MRQPADRAGARSTRAQWSGVGALALALVVALASIPSAAWSQPAAPRQAPPAQVEAPPAPAPEVVAPEAPPDPEAPPAPEAPAPGDVPDETLDRIDRALDEVEERIEEDAEASGEARDGRLMRERRERIREIREQVHRRLRERSDRSDNKVAFGSSIHVEEGEVARDSVAIGGSVTVEGDIEGDVVAVGGSVSIDGRVTGDVVAVGGSVDLGDEAEVLGEVTSVGGRVNRDEGAEVMGRINEVGFGPNLSWDLGDTEVKWWDWKGHRHFSPFGFGWFGFGLSLVSLVLLLLLTSLVRLVAGRTVERVRAKAVESPWLCALVGLAVELFFLPVLVVVTVILAISIIGIPLILLLPFVVIAFLVALIVGFTGASQAAGEWIGRRFGRPPSSPFAAVMMGVLAIQALHIIGEFFDSFEGFLWFFAVMFGIVGLLVRYAAWTVGIGAVFLTATRRSGQAAMLAVPPAPPADYPPPYPPPEPPAPAAPPAGWSARPLGEADPYEP